MNNMTEHVHNTKRKLWMSGGVFLIAFVVLVGLIIYIERVADRVAEKQQVFNDYLQQENYLTELKELMRTLDSGRTRIAHQFVETGAEVDYIEVIENLGKDTGVELDVRSVTRDERTLEKKKKYAVLRLGMVAEGSWQEILSFLGSLETAPLALSIESFDMETHTEDTLWSMPLIITIAFDEPIISSE